MFQSRPDGVPSRLALFLAVGVATSALCAGDLGEYYGFGGMEILKLDWELGTPLAADLNGDSLNDLVVCNNRKARIELLLQKPGFDPNAAEVAPEPDPENVNDLFGREARWRFKRFQYPLHVKATSLALADFNHDQRPDLAYYSAEGLYVVLQNRGEGIGTLNAKERVWEPGPPLRREAILASPHQSATDAISEEQGRDALATTLSDPSWEASTRFDLRDGLKTPDALACGDLNGDGLTDLVLLVRDGYYVLFQGADGRMARPVRHYSSSGSLRQVEIGDVSGDGRGDLVLLTGELEECPLRIRMQHEDGSLGPEGRYAVPAPSVLRLCSLDDSGKQAIALVSRQSGRLSIHAMVQEDQEKSEVSIHPLPSGDDVANRDMTCADVDGDGLTDMVVTDPARGQFLVFSGQAGSGLSPAAVYPGLKDMRKICAARLGDGPGDTLVVLSVDEKLIALSRFEGSRGEGVPPLRREAILASPDRPATRTASKEQGQDALATEEQRRDALATGRLQFPQTVAVVGEPQAMELADLDQDGRLDLAYVAKGPDPAEAFFLRSVLRIGQEASEPGPSLKLTDVDERPENLLACDVDHDGDTDLIVVRSYDPLLLVRQTAARVFEQQAQDQTHSGLVSNLGSCGISLAPLGKEGRPALLVARGEFARSMYFNAEKGWQVIDQYQAGDGRRQIRVAAAVPGQAGGAPGIVAYDDASGIAFFMDPQTDGTYRVSREIDVGTAKVRKILAGRFGDGDTQELVLCAERELICLRPTAQWGLRQVAGFEPSIEDGQFGHFTIGDVNGDGAPDVVLCEPGRHHVQVLAFNENARLADACKFKVFEEHPHNTERPQGHNNNSGEPRHVLVRDITGDGRNDLVLLVHDRLIVYPQDGTN